MKIHSVHLSFNGREPISNQVGCSTDLFFIGDIHGKHEYLSRALEIAREQNGKLICVGDLFDSYDRSLEDQFKCVDIIAQNSDDILCIAGNHDLGYLDGFPTCSGRSFVTRFMMNSAIPNVGISYSRWISTLPHIFVVEFEIDDLNPCLVSHAGLTSQLLSNEQYNNFAFGSEVISVEEVIDLTQSVGSLNNGLLGIGNSRGGSEEVGGIFWCDLNDDFCPIPNISQIFGHTKVSQVYAVTEVLGNLNFAIDCLDSNPQILHLSTKDGELKWFVVDIFPRLVASSTPGGC